MKYLFLKYNNYFDRINLLEDILDDYVDAVDPYSHAPSGEFNFNERDNINTNITFNWTQEWNPDYLVVYEGNWSDNNIISRWFIIRQEKVRKDQYKFDLKRDIISDYKKDLKKFTANIDRCNLDSNNPLIFNREDFQFNQIKKQEYQLFDKTGCPWVVGYLANNASAKTINIPISNNFDVDLSGINHDAWEYYTYSTNPAYNATPNTATATIALGGYKISGSEELMWQLVDITDGSIGTRTDTDATTAVSGAMLTTGVIGSYYYWKGRQPKLYWSSVIDAIKTYNKSKYNALDIDNLLAFNGKKILFKDGTYEIKISKTAALPVTIGGSKTKVNDWSYEDPAKSIHNALLGCFNAVTHNQPKAYVEYTIDQYKVSITQVRTNSISFTIPGTVKTLTDAPYKLFCFPYPTSNPLIEDGCQNEWISDYSKKLIQAIQNAYTSTELYDLQLLPYCPIEFSGYNINSGTYTYVHQSAWTENTDYIKVTDTTDNSTMGYIYFSGESSSKFTLNKIGTLNYNQIFKVSNKKISNETTNYRFCAPNYSSAFDFSLAMNNGLSGVDVYITYKPYNPYIQVTPIFGGLYGESFDDSRGLILQGDYSLPKADSAWQTYELNNKTYQQSFNREIQSMKVQNDITNTNNIWKVATSAIGAGVSGAMTGSLIGGGPIGAAVGGVVSAGASLAGGIADTVNTKKLQAEQLSAKTDQFNYSLQNIKAQPNTLTKTSAINATNKYVPFIEYYSATDEEIQILEDYILYNGMKAGYVGKIDFSGYVQANILRTNGVQINATELSVLNEELMKGVYLQ